MQPNPLVPVKEPSTDLKVTKRKKTIIFLVKCKIENTDAVITAFLKLKRFQGELSTRVFLCLTCHDQNVSAIINTIPNKAILQPSGPLITVAFEFVGKVDVEVDEKYEFRQFYSKLNGNISNKEDLQDLLSADLFTDIDKENLSIMTWGHGSGYAIFTDSVQTSTDSNIKSQNTKDAPELSTDDFAKVLRKCFGQRLQLLIVENCYMNSFDAIWSIRDCFETVIACENLIDPFKADFQLILELMNKTTETEAKAITREIISSLKKNFPSDEEHVSALFASDLRKVGRSLSTINKIFKALLKMLDQNATSFILALKDAAVNPSLFLYDLETLQQILFQYQDLKKVSFELSVLIETLTDSTSLASINKGCYQLYRGFSFFLYSDKIKEGNEISPIEQAIRQTQFYDVSGSRPLHKRLQLHL